MAGPRRPLISASAAAGLLAIVRGEWILGKEEESCTKTCKRTGRLCSERHWPKSAQELHGIAANLHKTCNAMQKGNVVYDPSIDLDFCGWLGDAKCRCDAKDTWPARRFCYCTDVKEPVC